MIAAEPLVEELIIVTELVKKFLAHDVYESATGPFSETVESNLHPPTLFNISLGPLSVF